MGFSLNSLIKGIACGVHGESGGSKDGAIVLRSNSGLVVNLGAVGSSDSRTDASELHALSVFYSGCTVLAPFWT